MFGTTTEENGKGFYTEQFGKFDEIHKIIIEAMSGRHSKKICRDVFEVKKFLVKNANEIHKAF